ncbi:unnamed protein product [Paramecium octaurelia]|uniref:Uncharacterized protein n=1 Tax=Paramecium octaurelia TaxID=43137 RepID=A0A8S1XVE5_PAROT|nr:unnamed protein product [Paramecium octaurelia]
MQFCLGKYLVSRILFINRDKYLKGLQNKQRESQATRSFQRDREFQRALNCFLKWQDFENSLFFVKQALFILESNSQIEIPQQEDLINKEILNQQKDEAFLNSDFLYNQINTQVIYYKILLLNKIT